MINNSNNNCLCVIPEHHILHSLQQLIHIATINVCWIYYWSNDVKLLCCTLASVCYWIRYNFNMCFGLTSSYFVSANQTWWLYTDPRVESGYQVHVHGRSSVLVDEGWQDYVGHDTYSIPYNFSTSFGLTSSYMVSVNQTWWSCTVLGIDNQLGYFVACMSHINYKYSQGTVF